MRRRDTTVRSPATAFIVRVWNEGDVQVRGEIEHLETGERRLFLDYGSLLAFIDMHQAEAAAK